MKTIKNEWYNWLILLIPISFFLVVLNRLPIIESYKLSFLMPYKVYNQFLLVLLGTMFFYVILYLKTRKKNHKGLSILKTLIASFGMVVSILFLSIEIGLEVNALRIIWIISAIFMIIFGNFYPVIKFKSFIGVNNKWTKKNPVIWKQTHVFTGRLWFISGTIVVLFSLIFNVANSELIYSIFIFTFLILPHLYSILISKRMNKHYNPSC